MDTRRKLLKLKRGRKPNTMDKFWETAENNDSGCLIWKGTKTKWGYGQFTINGKRFSTHRLAYIKTYGPIPQNICVLHRCDNRACVKPTHLWLGTHADNSRDCVEKNRQFKPKGALHPLAKLTNQDVIAIRDLSEDKSLETKIIAELFSVSPTTILDINKRKTWSHIK